MPDVKRILKRWGILAVMLLVMGASAADAQEATELFRQNCISCHTIGGGKLVGPDLKNVDERKDRTWLVDFVVDPTSMLDRGDPYALQLKDAAGGVVMPRIAGLTRKQAESLMDLVAAESLLEQSQFAGLTLGDEPFTAFDIQRGGEYFSGQRRLANGGPSCLSCHTIGGLAGLRGGRLGPDLTRVYERLQGRKNLASWLQAPATEIMRPIYLSNSITSDEIKLLVAYLEDTARNRAEDNYTARLILLLLGLGGAGFGFMLADGVWRNRFRGVRRALVRGER
jgi:mono/diheme cytochrome c family protein